MSEAAPGEAYYEIAAFLGEDYFLRPTPEAGRLVTIAGRDGVVTRWHVDMATSLRLIQYARDCPEMAPIESIPYNHGALR